MIAIMYSEKLITEESFDEAVNNAPRSHLEKGTSLAKAKSS